VDDVVLTASSPTLLRALIDTLLHEFSMKDLGPLQYFLLSPDFGQIRRWAVSEDGL
jgi:hypothetical protein